MSDRGKADRGAEPKPSTELLDATVAHALVDQFTLRVVHGPDAGATVTASGPRLLIGTHPSAELRLGDTAVSRFHCEISVSSGKPLIRDLESRNGTGINGVIVLAAQLRHDDLIQVGRTAIAFELGERKVKVSLSEHQRFQSLVGRSAVVRAAFALLERAAQSDATVLLLGETGTGKDAAAEAIHMASERRDGPFVVVDCVSRPGGLLESELFGHEKGAFTSADRAREGAFEAARGGTLFIDEIGDLSLELQPVLLRVLEHREVQRVGSNRRIPVDVRVVAATNRDLRADVNAHRFRHDLYYRLAVLEVTLPPLRDRLDDLPLLVDHFLERLEARDLPVGALLRSEPSLAELRRHAWPGNMRELRNYLERCVAFEQQLPPTTPGGAAGAAFGESLPLGLARELCVREFERRYCEALLRRFGDNVSAAARAAGVDRSHFHRLLAKVGLR